MKGLVLDLRFNPGGLLSEAVAVADLFLETGTITSVRGRTGPAEIYTAKPEGTFPAFPMVLLVNKETASAAEIVAGALVDNGRAVLVGERTFGQGLVKQLIDLDHGKGALKLPTAAYYRPNGKGVHRFPNATEEDEWGVSPEADDQVSSSKEETALLRLHYVAIENGREADPFDDRALKKAVAILSKR
jgi:carboxyl-terminal processing protease